MSRLATVDFDWADDNYSFALKIEQLIELQEKCDAGPAFVLARLQQKLWRVEDVRETIRLGLIGAGMEPRKATKLVRTWVDERPLAENVIVAEAIVAAALYGAPEGKRDAPPEKQEADQTTTHSSAARFAGPPISEPGSPPDSVLQTSDPVAFGNSPPLSTDG